MLVVMSYRQPIFSLTKADFQIDWFSGTGAGGQHRNKHQNCVRIKDMETGIVAQCSAHRERPSNFRTAFRRLAEKLTPYLKQRAGISGELPPKSDEIVRTYSAHHNYVKCHKSKFEQSWDQASCNLGDMIAARNLAIRSAASKIETPAFS